MNLARANDAAARKFVSLNFTGLLQTCTNSGRKVASSVPPEEEKVIKEICSLNNI